MHTEVIIIGGGSAGCAAVIELARLGRRVVLVERQRFPRFHIGESLLPVAGNWRPPLHIRLKLEFFFALVAAQRFLPLAPRSHSV